MCECGSEGVPVCVSVGGSVRVCLCVMGRECEGVRVCVCVRGSVGCRVARIRTWRKQ